MKLNWIISMASVIMLVSHSQSQQFKNCDFFQSLSANVTHTITSPKYSRPYPKGASCRWAVEAPPGHNVLVNCREIKMSASWMCSRDGIVVSTTGRADLRDASSHCGRKSFTLKSRSTRLTMALRSSRHNGAGGRFKCTLRTVEDDSCNCGQMNRAKIGLSTSNLNVYCQ